MYWSLRCFTCYYVGLANPKVTDGENGRFHAVVWGFCHLGVLMLCSKWLGERSSLISLSSLMALVNGRAGQKMLCKFFCKHVQLYLIACLLSTKLGPSICCIFLHVLYKCSHPCNVSVIPCAYAFSLWNFTTNFPVKTRTLLLLFMFVYYFLYNCYSSNFATLRILNRRCLWEWRLNC
jgi:hypothetical protein